MRLDHLFTLAEALSILGLLQCVFILTLIVLKAADIYRTAPTVAFFTALGLGFGASDSLAPLVAAMIPALSYFLVIQVAFARLPAPRHLAVFVVPLLGPPAAWAAVVNTGLCTFGSPCPEYVTFLRAFVVVPGALVLLVLWMQRGLLGQIWIQQDSHDRYWVVLTLVAFNALNLGVDLARVAETLTLAAASLTRAILGLVFVYLVTTLVFRIEPKSVVLLPGLAILHRGIELTLTERALAIRIRDTIKADKLFQDQAFSRAGLARELMVSKQVVSRVIGGAFAKSFRQLLDACRIEEAMALLRNSELHEAEIAFDVGIDSLGKFNRMFRRIAGQSPTEYRIASELAGDPDFLDGEAGVPELKVVTPGPTGRPR